MATDKGVGPLEFHFLGVSTAHSTAQRMFPQWMGALGLPEVRLVGVDLPLHAAAAQYRQAVLAIRDDAAVAGGLVTTHKIDLLEATRDLFAELDPYARLCGEVNTIAKDGMRLVGYATDPQVGGACLRRMLGPNYFGRTGGHVLCLGAGGAGTALALMLAGGPAGDRPAAITLADTLAARLEHARGVLDRQGACMPVAYVMSETAARNDALLADLPPGSLVINATGMGKDRPGSPITDGACFPAQGVVWELNYRGELGFLHQARAQERARALTITDGWDYFVRGWATVIGHVLRVEINEAIIERLGELAVAVR